MIDFKKMSDDELAKESQNGEERKFWGALIESQRRLRDSNKRLSWVNTCLAFAGVLLAAVQVWLANWPPHQLASQSQTHSTQQAKPAQPPDPLGFFTDNKPLHDCLVQANPDDPAGLRSETAEQAARRKACITKYAPKQ